MDWHATVNRFGLRNILFASAAFVAISQCPAAATGEQGNQFHELVEPLLNMGLSTARLVWLSAEGPASSTAVNPSVYSNLALDVQRRIDEGRLASKLVGANMNLVSATAAYAAMVDPEPLTKLTASVFAYAAKKTGDYLVEQTLEDSQKQARKILAAGLKGSGLTDAQLKRMSSEEIAAHVGAFKIGSSQLKDILTDADSLRMLQDQMIDMVSDSSLEALRRTDVLQLTVGEVRTAAAAAREKIDDVREVMEARTDKLEKKLSALAVAVEDNAFRLRNLKTEVNKNTKSIEAVAQISYSGWTTQQKLQAVRSNLFLDLSGSQKEALIMSLESQQRQEKLISDARLITGDLASIKTIASNLNLPSDVIDTVGAAATIATGATQFLSGDYLGAVGSITSLGGMGRPDAGAERHRQMMAYLGAQFKQVNERLIKISELQLKTIEALNALRSEQQSFREDVMAKLGQIESITLANNKILQALIRNEWRVCDSLVNNPEMNGEFAIKTREKLLAMLSDNAYRSYAVRCYRTMSEFLDARILPGDWSGQVIAANAVPDELTPADNLIHQRLIKLQQLDQQAYSSAARLLMAGLDTDELQRYPAQTIIRIAQPLATERDQQRFAAAGNTGPTQAALRSFTCDDRITLATALRELICFEPQAGVPRRPKADRIGRLLQTALLGPQVERVLKEGVLLATLADLSFVTAADDLKLVGAADILQVSGGSLSQELKAATQDRNGLKLLEKLRRLSESYVLQQATTYGDFTAAVALEMLYDTNSRSLNAAPNDPVAAARATAAIDAMKANPVLARNVVLLALRRAIADQLGGVEAAEKANYLETRYRWALENFKRGDRCGNDEIGLREWKSLFPAWTLVYRASAREKAEDITLSGCRDALRLDLGDRLHPEFGVGAAVELTPDLYVALPSAMEMSIGRFERPESLTRALALRDKVNQAIGDRRISESIAGAVSADADRLSIIRQVSFDLVEGLRGAN